MRMVRMFPYGCSNEDHQVSVKEVLLSCDSFYVCTLHDSGQTTGLLCLDVLFFIRISHSKQWDVLTHTNLLLGSMGCWFFPAVFRLLSSVKITSPFCSPFFLCRIGGSLFNCPAVFLLRFCVTCAVVILPNGEGHSTGQTSGGGCGKAMLANRDPASDLILWTLAYGWETISPALCKAGL